MFDADRVKRLTRPTGLQFQIGKIGHIVINVRDVAKSADFYTQIQAASNREPAHGEIRPRRDSMAESRRGTACKFSRRVLRSFGSPRCLVRRRVIGRDRRNSATLLAPCKPRPTS